MMAGNTESNVLLIGDGRVYRPTEAQLAEILSSRNRRKLKELLSELSEEPEANDGTAKVLRIEVDPYQWDQLLLKLMQAHAGML